MFFFAPIFGHMNMPLRITFEGRDYIYKVITKHISKDIRSIKIDLEGTEYEIRSDINNEWNVVDGTVNDHPQLLHAVTRNIKLRYRL